MHNSRVLRYFADRTACVLDIIDERELVAKTAWVLMAVRLRDVSQLIRVTASSHACLVSTSSPSSLVVRSTRSSRSSSALASRRTSLSWLQAAPPFVSQVSRYCAKHSLLTAQVGKQNAIYAIPLVMEPRAAFYTSPMVVLDFQSLYPSVMIAYNYCYSTCLGRIKPQNGQWKFGVLDNFELPPGLLGEVEDHINGSPLRLQELQKVDVCFQLRRTAWRTSSQKYVAVCSGAC